jgi:threonine 3-dehydrogenase
MAIAVARHAGARKIAITDVSLPRLELAKQLGADLAIDVSTTRVRDAQRELGMREGFDVGMEMSGHPSALPEMIDNMNHGGRIAMLGLPSQEITIDWAKVVTHMLTLKGIYGREMYETWYAMSAMLSSNPVLRAGISAVVTDTLPATDWEKGFDIARNGVGGKVVLDWTRL